MRKRLIVGGVLAGVAAIGTASVLFARDAFPGSDAGVAPPAATALVSIRDLSKTQTLSGVVAYRDMRALSSAQAGTVTALPAVGTDLTSGDILLRVNDRPVVLLAGDIPAWRDMQSGMDDGPDVLELETALLALGHGTKSGTFPDAHWDSRTTTAVKDFQAGKGAVVDGRVGLGEVLFTHGDIHVAKREVSVGSQIEPGSPVLMVQSTDRVVDLDVNPLDKGLFVQGAPVQVELPSGEQLAGTIESISTALEMNAEGKGIFKAKVALADPAAVKSLQLAPVTVRYPTTVAKQVLSVPVNAIIGVPGGGYAVDLIGADGNSTRVTVALGAWGDGFVEVTGNVPEGSKVEVPK